MKLWELMHRALDVAGHPAALVKVVEDTKACRALGVPVYKVSVKESNSKRGRHAATFYWLQ